VSPSIDDPSAKNALKALEAKKVDSATNQTTHSQPILALSLSEPDSLPEKIDWRTNPILSLY